MKITTFDEIVCSFPELYNINILSLSMFLETIQARVQDSRVPLYKWERQKADAEVQERTEAESQESSRGKKAFLEKTNMPQSQSSFHC